MCVMVDGECKGAVGRRQSRGPVTKRPERISPYGALGGAGTRDHRGINEP